MGSPFEGMCDKNIRGVTIPDVLLLVYAAGYCCITGRNCTDKFDLSIFVWVVAIYLQAEIYQLRICSKTEGSLNP
jgi:hypothetical protein